jgi:starch synthase
MAAAIRCADRVNTVSPTYAQEILRPSDHLHGFFGGEGLEGVLRQAAERGRLTGILNGCAYPESVPNTTWPALRKAVAARGALVAEDARLRSLSVKRPRHLLLSVGRVVGQKVGLLLQPLEDHETALDALLDALGDRGLFILLGSGEPALERRLAAVATRHANFLLLRGYDEALSEALYGASDLFLMPSSFEPCGISQMLAMRVGTPCLVHKVGGLADTVEHMVNGFSFEGDDLPAQVKAMLLCFNEALQVQSRKLPLWNSICKNARETRFGWDKVIKAYEKQLYS